MDHLVNAIRKLMKICFNLSLGFIQNVFIYWKEITFIQQRCIKLIRSDSKYIYNVTKDFYFNYTTRYEP